MNPDVLCLDPGKTTGVVYAVFYPDRIIVKPYQEPQTSCLWLWRHLIQRNAENVVCEDFEFRRHLAWAELFPVQLIGVLNLYFEKEPKEHKLYMQKARLIHGTGAFFDNKEKIKELGLYKPGDSYHHAMDAMRHFLHWCFFGAGNSFLSTYERPYPFELVI